MTLFAGASAPAAPLPLPKTLWFCFSQHLVVTLFFRDRKNQRSHRFDAVDADQGSKGPLDPP